jgi:hypothetical protein
LFFFLSFQSLYADDLLTPDHPKVKESLKKALPHLKQFIPGKQKAKPSNYTMGYAMLSLLAYVECLKALGTENPYHLKEVQKAMKIVIENGRKDLKTYHNGLLAMLLKDFLEHADSLGYSNKKIFSKKHVHELMEKICQRLEASLTSSLLYSYDLVEGKVYGKKTTSLQIGDFSNTQYAVLGLAAIHSSGIEINSLLIEKILRSFLDAQNTDGAWSYTPRAFTSSASMTCAGLASLGIFKQMNFPASVHRKIDRALKRGLEWMKKNYEISLQYATQGWWAYTLYGVERVGVFLDLKNIGPHDWYDAGARALLKKQLPDGHYFPVRKNLSSFTASKDAFAVLFLSKGSRHLVKKIRKYEISDIDNENTENELYQNEIENFRTINWDHEEEVEIYCQKLCQKNPEELFEILCLIQEMYDTPFLFSFKKILKSVSNYKNPFIFNKKVSQKKLISFLQLKINIDGGFSTQSIQFISSILRHPQPNKYLDTLIKN